MLSPSLFVLYTNDLARDSDKVFIQKYADDTVVVGLCDGEEDSEYLKYVNFVNDWCKTNYLKLNVQKTKELIWDFRKSKQDRKPVRINDMNVEVVPTYKYLGVIMDNKLSFAQHAEGQLVKVQKRLYCVRSMFKLRIDYTLIRLFYEATIPPLLLYACVAFYGLLTKKIKTDLEKPKCITERLLRRSQLNIKDFDSIYHEVTLRLSNKIIKNNSHPLKKEFVLLPSGLRYRLPSMRTTRFKDTFIVKSIEFLNLDNVARNQNFNAL